MCLMHTIYNYFSKAAMYDCHVEHHTKVPSNLYSAAANSALNSLPLFYTAYRISRVYTYVYVLSVTACVISEAIYISIY